MLEQRPVLDARHFQLTVDIDVEPEVGLHGIPESLDLGTQTWHPRELVDPVVERIMPADPLPHVCLGAIHAPDQKLKFVERVLMQVSGGLGRRKRLERTANPEHFAHLIQG